MRALVVLISVAVVAVTAALAVASEQSKRLQALGLVEFHAGRYPEALGLLDRALADDPEDVGARYYRAITRGRLGDYDSATSDLRSVLAADPDFDHAWLELGVALVQKGEYDEAIEWLERAQGVPDFEARASLFLGIAQLRLGQREAARPNFERAGNDPEWSHAARYYEGIVDYQEGNWGEAAQHFASVAAATPESEMGHEAVRFLDKMRQATALNYRLYGSVGFEYDSNVQLAPSDATIKEDLDLEGQESDGRFTLSVGGFYVPWRIDQAELMVGYEAYQSVHLELSQFNLQDHRPSLQAAARLGMVWLGVLARYDYYLLETDSFLQEATALPWITIREGAVGRTEVSYRMRRRDFKKRSFFLRDSFNHAPGVRQFVYLGSPDRYLWLGYQFDSEDPVVNERLVDDEEAMAYAYDGHQIGGGIGWLLPALVVGDLGYTYRHERYNPASKTADEGKMDRVAGDRRRDEEHRVIASFSRQLTDHLDVRASYIGTFNNSNDPAFNYERHIGALALTVRY